jgi:hypothetical protein
MSSTTESSFGAKLRRAQDLLTYIQGFAGYTPPRTQESATGFQTLISLRTVTLKHQQNQHF